MFGSRREIHHSPAHYDLFLDFMEKMLRIDGLKEMRINGHISWSTPSYRQTNRYPCRGS